MSRIIFPNMHCVCLGKQGKGDLGLVGWMGAGMGAGRMGAGMDGSRQAWSTNPARYSSQQHRAGQTWPRAQLGPRASVWNVNIIPAREKEASHSPRVSEVNVWQGNRGMINREVQPCSVGWESCSRAWVWGHQGWVTKKHRVPAGSVAGMLQ